MFLLVCNFYKVQNCIKASGAVGVFWVCKSLVKPQVDHLHEKKSKSQITLCSESMPVKDSYLSTESTARIVQKMEKHGVTITQQKAGRPLSAKFPGGPTDVDIWYPPIGGEENKERFHSKHGVIPWDVKIGGEELQDKSMEERKSKATKANVSVSFLTEEKEAYERITRFDKTIRRSAVDLIMKSYDFLELKSKQTADDLMELTKFVVREKPESSYPPHMELVLKSGVRKFNSGFITDGFYEETGKPLRPRDPTFGWFNMDEHLLKNTVVHKIRGGMDYGSIFIRGKEIASINLQFKVDKMTISPPIDENDTYDSDEMPAPTQPADRPLKRKRENTGNGGDCDNDSDTSGNSEEKRVKVEEGEEGEE